MISFSKPGRLLFYGARSLLLTDRNGRVIAQGQSPRARLDLLDSGAAVSADGQHLAYRLSDARPGAHRGMAVLYLLHPGDKALRRSTGTASARSAAASEPTCAGTAGSCSTAPPTAKSHSSTLTAAAAAT